MYQRVVFVARMLTSRAAGSNIIVTKIKKSKDSLNFSALFHCNETNYKAPRLDTLDVMDRIYPVDPVYADAFGALPVF